VWVPQAIKTIFINYSLQVGPLGYTFEHPVFSVGSNVYSHLSSMGQKKLCNLYVKVGPQNVAFDIYMFVAIQLP